MKINYYDDCTETPTSYQTVSFDDHGDSVRITLIEELLNGYPGTAADIDLYREAFYKLWDHLIENADDRMVHILECYGYTKKENK